MPEASQRSDPSFGAEPDRTIHLVSADRLFRECLAEMLSSSRHVEVVGSSDGPAAAAEALEERPADVVLVDCTDRRNGVEETLWTLSASDRRMMVLGNGESSEEPLRCLKAGAHAYLLSEASLGELEGAIGEVLRGGIYCSPRVTFRLCDRLGSLARERRRRLRVESLRLTPRELEVLQLASEGLTNRQIAERLHLSVYTVKNHVHRVLDKLEACDRKEAVEIAFRNSWLRERRRRRA